MKTVYIANIRLPTEKAHGIQVMKMCEAFARKGVDVELVVPMRFNHIREDPFIYYGTEQNFLITRIPSIDLVRFGLVGFGVQYVSFSVLAILYILFKRVDFVYTRENLIAGTASVFKRGVFWEVHNNSFSFLSRAALRRAKGIITVTKSLKDFFVLRKVPEKKLYVAHDGVDIDAFQVLKTKEEARKLFGLPLDKKIILYTGHLYPWKGADTLARATHLLPEDAISVFVGGTDGDVFKFRNKYRSNAKCLVLGPKPYTDIPLYLRCADILVIPNSAKYEQSALYTSPMKLFEYMASGVPIVASHLPSVREILNENNAFFVRPDDAPDLARVLNDLLTSKDRGKTVGEHAIHDAKNFTWTKRAEGIINFITSR